MAARLVTIPLDTQLEILGWIPDFRSLNSCILINRSFSQLFAAHRSSLTKTVAKNHFGEHLEDALILANTQKKRKYSDAKDHNYKTAFIRRLLSNEAVLETAEPVIFQFLTGSPTPPTATEAFRLRRAAYRFQTFCNVERTKREWFLSTFPVIELAELGNLYRGVESWVKGMYPQSFWDYGDDHSLDRMSSVISTGLGSVSWLWELLVESGEDPENGSYEFEEAMGISGDGMEEGFFQYDFYTAWEPHGYDIETHQPILDEGHNWLTKTVGSK
ncbi:hypothetical protein DFH06DRAFT_1187660 [Mycena polygramma]|nr:hypothetical protein DFH06DRAFT_1187660 [Mycena polygramma]